jgi:hypothetical protein
MDVKIGAFEKAGAYEILFPRCHKQKNISTSNSFIEISPIKLSVL